VSSAIASSIGISRPGGVLIKQIFPGGPADQGGLMVGDVIRRVNAREVNDPRGLSYRIAISPIGEIAELDVFRGKERLTLSIPLSPPPEVPPRNVTDIGGTSPVAGTRVANLSPALAEELGLDIMSRAQGVIILDVERDSFAARIRLKPGDVFVNINGHVIVRIADIRGAVEGTREWVITFKRGNQELKIAVRG
jgi:serine protease Do